jgi:hypothetical protein
VFSALAYVHGQLLRLGIWLLKLPFAALWSALLAVVALLGEEFRRWAGLAVAGLLIVGTGKATLSFAPAELERPLVLTVLVLLVVWALAVKRAAYWTMHNNLVKVRQRQAFRELKGDVRDLRGDAIRGMARATQGTPIEGAFRSNRADKARAQQHAQAAAEQEAAERQAAAERDQHLDELAAAEPSPYA